MASMADSRFDIHNITHMATTTIVEAAAELGEPVGFILLLGTPGVIEGCHYASNLEREGAIETLEGMLQLLKLGAFEPEPGGKPN